MAIGRYSCFYCGPRVVSCKSDCPTRNKNVHTNSTTINHNSGIGGFMSIESLQEKLKRIGDRNRVKLKLDIGNGEYCSSAWAYVENEAFHCYINKTGDFGEKTTSMAIKNVIQQARDAGYIK